MDNINIEMNKRYLLLRTNYKLIEKLITMHTKQQISDDVFTEKLTILRSRLEKDFTHLSELEEKIEVLTKNNTTEVLITEFFCYYNFFEAAEAYKQKKKIDFDIQFYKKLHEIKKNIEINNYDKITEFIKTNKIHLKNMTVNNTSTNDIENYIKISIFLDKIPDNKADAITYLQENVKFDINDIKKYLPALLHDEELVKENYQKHANSYIYENFRALYFALYKQPMKSRLETRMAIGVMAFHTKMCSKKANVNCPTCLVSLEELCGYLPMCKKETSIILCAGSNELIDEVNRPYVFDSGYVYGENYMKKMDYNYVCKITGTVCKKNPRLCYFL